MPQYDEWSADADDDLPESPAVRWMSALVIVVAVAGFIALAWYAYHAGRQPNSLDEVELVKADETPIKEEPADPGGQQFPHQDKTVYGLISGAEPKTAERVLPPPEEPSAEAWINPKVDPEAAKQNAPEPEPVAEPEKPKFTPPPREGKKPEKKSEPRPQAKPSAARVQLGAYRSREEAAGEWAKIRRRHSGVIADKDADIVRAEVPGKGAFYRLQIAQFAGTREARSFCGALSERGQACITVSGK